MNYSRTTHARLLAQTPVQSPSPAPTGTMKGTPAPAPSMFPSPGASATGLPHAPRVVGG